ncbi:MAG: pyruvate dehydrogenase (acetyl-transferring) E1 component subunit alpha [Chloroflexi bacterium]|nr:pyruvate dehydrogenase (acetyl-transferring) E1 component subunit alpha [Chloroflexota bacterium]
MTSRKTERGKATRGDGRGATATASPKGAERSTRRNGPADNGATTAERQVAPEYDLRKSSESPETLVEFYRQMMLIRRFEEKTGEMYTRAKIGGYCHLNLGEEATIVGAMSALEPRDYIFTNYREHGYSLARGMDPKRVMAELFGKETGISRGRGGSMHLFDVEARFMGGYAIVGGQLPLATGAGLAISYRGGDEVVLCQMGDGTTNIGAFHESLNIAQLWKLPVIFFIVNNQYGMGTTVEKGSALPELYQKACAHNMRSERVDGNDLLAVREATQRAVEVARTEKLPTLLEAVSYRFRGHSVVDPARYRPEDEVQRWRALDPVLAFARSMREAGFLDEARITEIDEEIGQVVEDSVRFADESADPKPDQLFTFDYATDVPNVDRSLPGDHAGTKDKEA